MNFLYQVRGLKTKGHYCLAAENNGLIAISGQLAFDPETNEPCPGEIGDEVRRILQNINLILGEFGCTEKNILKLTVYIPSAEYWGEANKAYESFFGDHKPARMVVPCGELNYGLHVEIEGLAVKA